MCLADDDLAAAALMYKHGTTAFIIPAPIFLPPILDVIVLVAEVVDEPVEIEPGDLEELGAFLAFGFFRMIGKISS